MAPLTDNQNGSVLGSTCFVRPLFVSPLVFIQYSASQANPKGTGSTNECCSQARSVAMLHNRRFTWVSSFYFTLRRLYSWRMKLLDVANFINTCMRKIFIYGSVAVLARTYSSLTPTATHPSRYHVSIQFQRWGHNAQQTKCFLQVNARFLFCTHGPSWAVLRKPYKGRQISEEVNCCWNRQTRGRICLIWISCVLYLPLWPMIKLFSGDLM